jgi:hypothetical protein
VHRGESDDGKRKEGMRLYGNCSFFCHKLGRKIEECEAPKKFKAERMKKE